MGSLILADTKPPGNVQAERIPVTVLLGGGRHFQYPQTQAGCSYPWHA